MRKTKNFNVWINLLCQPCKFTIRIVIKKDRINNQCIFFNIRNDSG